MLRLLYGTKQLSAIICMAFIRLLNVIKSSVETNHRG